MGHDAGQGEPESLGQDRLRNLNRIRVQRLAPVLPAMALRQPPGLLPVPPLPAPGGGPGAPAQPPAPGRPPSGGQRPADGGWRRWRRPAFLVSALLHAALLVALLLTWQGREQPSGLPEAGVPVIFEDAGDAQRTARPQEPPSPPMPPPSPESAAPPPPALAEAPQPEAAPLAPPAPPVMTPPVEAPQPEPAPQAQEAPPPPAPPPQPPRAAEEELPPPPPPAPPAPPRPAAPAPARPPAPHRAPSPFAGALDLSRGPAVNLSQAVPRPNIRPNATGQGRGLDLSFNAPSPRAPRAASPSDLGTSVRIQGANPGADWMAAFRAWLDRNGYYPQMAAMAGEDGTATVRFTVQKDGRVQDLRLVSRSGSKWLDMGAQAMLRDKTLPPFPEGTKADSTEITLTIDYILIRR